MRWMVSRDRRGVRAAAQGVPVAHREPFFRNRWRLGGGRHLHGLDGMTNAAHTPGPWKVVAVTGEISVEDYAGRTIWGPVPRDSDENVEGDALLIAAAPTMLAALRGMATNADEHHLGYDDGEWHALDLVRGAITCATGGLSRTEQEERDEAARQIAPELLRALIAVAESIERGELDERICCDGRDCGCHGASHSELMLHDLRILIAKANGGTA